MTTKNRKIKVLLAQFPLETHSRGVITVAGMLKDAGMEVVLIGNDMPKNIIDTAVQEDVDVVGISTYCGGELALGQDLMDAAAKKKIKDSTVFLIGGIFPPKNGQKLMDIGFSGAFLVGKKEEIVACIKKGIEEKRPAAC